MNGRIVLIWILAVVLTAATAYYQRTTGPSYPIKGSLALDNQLTVSFNLERSHVVSSDYTITLPLNNPDYTGTVTWRRYNSDDEWQQLLMQQTAKGLTTVIPRQPAAGKVEYMVTLHHAQKHFNLTTEPVIMRFRGEVPAYILLPHIVCMFLMFLFSNRAGLEYFNTQPRFATFTWLAFGFIILGGLILGPITQKFAFGAYWTGFPFGHDLTDNKTLIAFLAWLPAVVKVVKKQNPRTWILVAAIITLAVFLVPHSVLGSELNYRKVR